ncbi:hypothetical protein SY83_16905 [Paenibacillus swuensis]|uniref:DUF1206 domain-containing protein n=1 Tax=Paenibacillus swuensis TaxID=1178515 RepID=A0A172TQ96_9BACL|nr:hypothetical protein SY83_16905 [Paenibacillus swuensis]
MRSKTSSASRQAEQAVQEASPWVDKLARLGYAAKGVVYSTIGILAIMTAAGFGGELTDKQGSLRAIGAQPFGSVILIILAIGLTGYFLWCMIQTFMDPDRNGTDWKGILKRIGSFASGIIYGSLAYSAIRTVIKAGGSQGTNEQSMTASLLEKPFGATMVAIAGVLVIALGIYQLIKAVKASFTKRFRKEEMSPRVYAAAVRISRVGITARAVVFGLIGYFLMVTAIQSDSSETKGLDGALAELAKQPYGQWLLGAVAIGLFAYGIYLFTLARYRKTLGSHR